MPANGLNIANHPPSAAVLVPVAAFGLLNRILAGAAMAFSSVSVVANGLRLYRLCPA